MAQSRGKIFCKLLQLPLLLLWGSLEQDLHCVKATQANITNSSEEAPHLLLNQSDQWDLCKHLAKYYFPDPSPVYGYCVQDCWGNFSEMMNNISAAHWCEWAYISRPYSDMRYCMEGMAEDTSYPYPNGQAEAYIFMAHETYFSSCILSNGLYDPPENILLTLTFIPICLIPFLVVLVVWKSKHGKLQT